MPALERQLRWYIAIRVVALVSVLLPYGLLQLQTTTPGPEIPEITGPPAPSAPAAPESAEVHSKPAPETLPGRVFLLLAGTTFVATLVYIALLKLLRRLITVQAYIQFFGDLVLITGLVYYLGGAASPFSLLYLIVIAVASTLLRRRAGVTVASVAFLLYGGMITALFF